MIEESERDANAEARAREERDRKMMWRSALQSMVNGADFHIGHLKGTAEVYRHQGFGERFKARIDEIAAFRTRLVDEASTLDNELFPEGGGTFGRLVK